MSHPNNLEKILAKTKKSKTGCLEWLGSKHGNGKYGYTTYMGYYGPAHRIVWMLTKGDIPKGMVVMHKCDNRVCINIKHLKLGTPKDNNYDTLKKRRQHWQNKTHCKNGHELTKENVRSYPGKFDDIKACRACGRENTKRYYWRKRGVELIAEWREVK